ncbi:MAG: arabinosyltransferase domain-containing protein [Gaiellaceae bacterium]
MRGLRMRAGLGLALIALVAALVGALGPAESRQTTYNWPPATLGEAKPTRYWYTPLLLIRHRPHAVTADVPCRMPSALPQAASSTVLSTARFPRRSGALAITLERGNLVVRVGRRVLTRVDLPERASAGRRCAYRLGFSGNRWSIEGGPRRLARDGVLNAMPVVSGLFSSLDLRSSSRPAISITTSPHTSVPTRRQGAAWWLGTLAALAAFTIPAIGPRNAQRLEGVGSGRPRTVVQVATPADGVVVLVLLGWWILAPAFYDDGWISARVRNYSDSNGFSAYYNAYGGNLPLGYWLETVHRWVADLSPTLLAQRVPALVCLGAIWVLCRWTFIQISGRRHEGVLVWVLLVAFITGALAWGMTMRPEPVIALLVTAVVACAVRFLEKPSSGPLTLAALFVVLALTAHPTGVLAVAPLLVCVRPIGKWARAHASIALSLCIAAAALLLVLLSTGADLGTRIGEARIQREYGDARAQWYHEALRYAYAGSSVQRASVALLLLAVLAFLTRRRRDDRSLLSLPSATIGVSMLLLLLTPSKHSTHLGVLIGVAAIAIAAETTRLRDRADTHLARRAVALAVVVASTLTIAWTWSDVLAWSPLEIRTFGRDGPELATLTAVLAASAIGLLAMASFEALRWVRAPSSGVRRPWPWVVVALSVPPVIFTAVAFAGDTTATGSWTLGRQNLQTFSGGERCGLADDARVINLQSVAALSTIRGAGSKPLTAEVANGDASDPPPIRELAFDTLRPLRDAAAYGPWFARPEDSRVGMFVAGITGANDRLEVGWGRERRGGIERLETDEVPVALRAETPRVAPAWRFIAAQELPDPPRAATALRIGFRSEHAPRAAVAVSALVTYGTDRLVDRIGGGGSRPLVLPNLLMYTPCVTLPKLADGVVEVPTSIVGYVSSWPVGIGTSPFDGILDLYRLDRFPISDDEGTLQQVAIYEVDRTIPGAARAAPRKLTFAS